MFQIPFKLILRPRIQPFNYSINTSPPMFTDSLQSLSLLIGDTLIYSLPFITDADRDNFRVAVDSGPAFTFTAFDLLQNTFHFHPLQPSEAGQYLIRVTLTDINPIPRSSYYLIDLVVTEPEPIFVDYQNVTYDKIGSINMTSLPNDVQDEINYLIQI